jgi:ABC-type glycerol-3-phosphate transport system substrate-binding protein
MITLVVWLPPEFDPESGTPGGDLLKTRLEDFEELSPGVRIEVRVKAPEGPGGLLESLTTASTAAPLALPDLIALPRPQLESAALKGLIYPYDELTTVLDSPDWYEYARQLARLQNSTFGLPFAGDALMLTYRPALVIQPPLDWAETLAISGTLAFPAADPEALFTLAEYQSAGGPVEDEQGIPTLDAGILAQVLTFFHQAEQVGVMPYWLTQYESYDQVWETFSQGQFSMTIAWASRHFNDSDNLSLRVDGGLIPTSDGLPFTLATGWVWALATTQPDRQALSVQLAEFLVDEAFLAEWTEASGLLPPRSLALESWKNASFRDLADQVALSAQLFPSTDVLSSLGPVLEEATTVVLKQQAVPVTAAQDAVDTLNNP